MPATASSAPSKAPRRARVRERNQALLLRAAERVFARAGFAGATVAGIAAEAGVPKANLHYYYPAKRDLYIAVLSNILALWLAETDGITAEADPRTALGSYIRAKMRFSREYPEASRVFANEVLHGAPEIGGFLAGELRRLVTAKSRAMRAWIAAGRMAEIDPMHLFFAIWATTQTYADFAAQVAAVSGAAGGQLSDARYDEAIRAVEAIFLRATGLEAAPLQVAPPSAR